LEGTRIAVEWGGQCGFAGYTDWRLPEVNLDGGTAELETILLASCPGGSEPCIDPIFGPTAPNFYWTANTILGTGQSARIVNFSNGGIVSALKTSSIRIRAVRTGP